jgi:hypothetical protein
LQLETPKESKRKSCTIGQDWRIYPNYLALEDGVLQIPLRASGSFASQLMLGKNKHFYDESIQLLWTYDMSLSPNYWGETEELLEVL